MELLAPCGNYESLIGVINAGADAVYLAGNKYGARAYADNFSDEEVIKAIHYAHLFNVKVYLTVNTLIKIVSSMKYDSSKKEDPLLKIMNGE